MKEARLGRGKDSGWMVMLRWLAAAGWMVMALVLALMVMLWVDRFYPGGRVEMPGPAGSSNRAFTANVGFGDITILLEASDWPRTFGRPVILGDMYGDANTPGSHMHWSVDGSVLATCRRPGPDLPELFYAAYDYREHRKLGRYDIAGEDDEIRALMAARGGLGERVTGVDDAKMTEYTSGYPVWGWLLGAAVMAGALPVAMRIGRGRRKLAAH